MIEWIANSTPKKLKFILRPPYKLYMLTRNGLQQGVRLIYRFADEQRLIGPNEIYDEEYYTERNSAAYRRDGQRVAKMLYDRFQPNSVIDLGCATGVYLETFHERSVTIHGVDGNKKAIENAVIPQGYLEQYDLRDPYNPDQSYDLVICFEVAEHLPEEYADTLVDSIVTSGDTVAFTAAPPGQPGKHHVNLQPRDYWIRKFEQRGFEYEKEAVSSLRTAIDVEYVDWIPKNLFIFTDKH